MYGRTGKGMKKNPRRAKPRLRRVRFTKSQRVDRRSTYRKHLASMRTSNTIVVNQRIAQNYSRPVQPQGETMRATTHQAATSVIADSNPVIRQWLKYKQTKFYRIWSKRPSFSYGSYTVIFLGMVVLGAMFLWWSMQSDIQYTPKNGTLLQQVAGHAYHSLSDTSCYLNMIGMVLIYLICITLINRFFIGTAVFGSIILVFAVATKIKVRMRQEPIIPSDLSFVSGDGGGAGEVASFITDESKDLVNAAITLLVWFVIICIVLQFVDKRRTFIYCSWRHPIAKPTSIFGLTCRILAPIVSVSLLMGYANALYSYANVHTKTSLRNMLGNIGYGAKLFNVLEDAQSNGALTTFLSLTRVTAMDNEPDYSKAAMQRIAEKYSKSADQINAQRTANLTDSTVVMILSESFSDPNRVSDIHYNIDPMPGIRALDSTTTSGLMLSPGYGGGTANIEFQQMTGLSMVNFSPTLLIPYQQLVSNRPKFYSFNQIWNENCGGKYSTECSVGYHPFVQYFYLRNANYKQFGFSHFYTLDSDPVIKYGKKYVGPNGQETNVSDEEAYKNVVDAIRTNTEQNKPSQYIQLITMQNHSPYPDVYGDANEFKAANRSEGIPAEELATIDNYTKGVQRTDQATIEFLNQLDQIDKPVTVVFYGDHLPGIYNTANADQKNALALHETNYFIWSNKDSGNQNRKLPESNASYSSSNYFMAQAAEQMNAKVSPYLALLDELHQEVPAMSRSVLSGTWNSNGEATYLDNRGNEIDPNKLSSKARELLADYKMVQYDMAAGKNYLWDMGFMNTPER